MIGKEILNYIIESKVGSGGMGTVYIARNKFIEEQKVAIKVIKGSFVDKSAKERLKKEAGILASLDHPNIVKFYNYDIDKDGNVCIVMEYAEGVTVEDYINTETGLIVESRILPLFEPILDAFEYAHKKGIVHRDIKPANIIISPDGKPKILDFGIASILKGDGTDGGQEAYILGTPSYMSPEQVYGRGIDTRTDIYSLGVLLHQMLTGNAPYDKTTLSELEIKDKVVTEPLPRMKTYYRYVSDKVQAIVDKATAKNPEERYQTCVEFKKALHGALVKKKVSKPFMALVGCLAVILIAGVGVLIDYNRTKVRYYKDYVEQWGVPQGIGNVSSEKKKHMNRLYRFEYKNYRLQRVSHINSVGSIIVDNESERADRPEDMSFFYTAEGQVDRVIVRNSSGKVLYVKDYNDKLNSVIFRFDDEYGTEKTLSGQTVGYINPTTDMESAKGKVTRYLLSYDEDGYVSKIMYAGFQNVRVCDADGIYGRGYSRDSKGRVIEERYLGSDSSPKSTKWGLGVKKFKYDSADNLVRMDYYTIDGKPARDSEGGTYVYEMQYDEWDNVVYNYHKDPDGKLMLPSRNGCAGLKFVYDDKGFNTRCVFMGLDGTSGYSMEDRISEYRYEYDANGYLSKVSGYDTEGNPCIGNNMAFSIVFVNDDKGNKLEMWCFGANDSLMLTNQDFAGVKFSYDSVGNELMCVYCGLDKQPRLMSDGFAAFKREYNEMGMDIKFVPLGIDMHPLYNKGMNVFIVHKQYDRRGNLIKSSYYDVDDSTLVLSCQNIAGWESEFDDAGNETKRSFFDTKGKMTTGTIGYAYWIGNYDEKGHLLSERYYGLDGKLIMPINESAGYDYKYDNLSRVVEEVPIGRNGKPYTDKSKNIFIIKCRYDDNDNVIETAYYDSNRTPCVCRDGYHKKTVLYDERKNALEERYFGKNGKPVAASGEKYAVAKYEYDDRGNCIRMYYFDVNDKPVLCKEGWASSVYEFNESGKVVKQMFFGVDGKPTDPKRMPPVGIAGYDQWGHMNYIASQDANGNFIKNINTGWSIERRKNDALGNILESSYYDTKDRPALCEEKFHKGVYKYNEIGLCNELRYYGTDGKPCLRSGGYHKESAIYSQQGEILELAYFDTKGKAVDNTSYGFHKYKVTVNDKGVPSTMKFYYADGSLIATQKWNGQAWVLQSPQNTSDVSSTDLPATQERVSQSQQDTSAAVADELSAFIDAYVDAFNDNCPLEFGSECENIVLKGVTGGKSSLTFNFHMPLSKYEIGTEQQLIFTECVRLCTEVFKEQLDQQLGKGTIKVTSIVYDSKGRELTRL